MENIDSISRSPTMFAQDGTLFCHGALLDRMDLKKPDMQCTLATWLLLNVFDGMRHPDYDAHALGLRLNAVYHPLANVSGRNPQVAYLVRFAEGVRRAIHERDAVVVIPELLDYAEWLAVDSRFDEGLTVLDSGTFAVDAGGNLGARARLARARGLTLRQMGRYNSAADEFTKGAALARQNGDPQLQIRCQNGLARCWEYLGRTERSKALLSKIRHKSKRKQFACEYACASHDLAVANRTPLTQALTLLSDAFQGYGEDNHSKKRVVCDLGHLLLNAGYVTEADRCLGTSQWNEEGTTFRAIALESEIRIASSMGDRTRFERAADEYLNIDRRLAVSADIDIRLRLGQGYLAFGENQKARIQTCKALELANSISYTAGEADARATLSVLEGHSPIDMIRLQPASSDLAKVFSSDLGDAVANMLVEAGAI